MDSEEFNRYKVVDELESYQILESGDEMPYNEMTELACIVTGCPISFISFPTVETQWYKSFSGIHMEDRNVPHGDSICSIVSRTSKELIINDMSTDPKFSKFYDAFQLKFYAGFPIYSDKGTTLGALCVMDSEARELSVEAMLALRMMSRNIYNLLDLRRQKLNLIKLNDEFDLVQRMAKVGTWELVLDTNQVNWSKGVYNIYGIPEGVPTNKFDGVDHYEEFEKPRLLKCIDDCAISKVRFDEVFQFRDAKGNPKKVRSIGFPVLNKKGQVTKLRGGFQDVTLIKDEESNK